MYQSSILRAGEKCSPPSRDITSFSAPFASVGRDSYLAGKFFATPNRTARVPSERTTPFPIPRTKDGAGVIIGLADLKVVPLSEECETATAETAAPSSRLRTLLPLFT